MILGEKTSRKPVLSFRSICIFEFLNIILTNLFYNILYTLSLIWMKLVVNNSSIGWNSLNESQKETPYPLFTANCRKECIAMLIMEIDSTHVRVVLGKCLREKNLLFRFFMPSFHLNFRLISVFSGKYWYWF